MGLTEAEAKLKDCIARRGQAKAAITRTEKFCNELSNSHTLEDVNIRLEALEKAYLEFIEYDFEVSSMGQASELEAIESRYFTIKAKLRKAAADRNTVVKDMQQQFHESMMAFADQQRGYLETLSTSFTTSNNNHVDVRSPKLNIPQFGGDYAEFPAFRDLYEFSVHTRESLTNAQKFQYLKGLLKEEAATLIRHINVTDANYEGAWTKLIERYDKKRCVVSNLLITFFSIQPIHQRSKVREGLYNIATEVLIGLEALGSDAQKREPWLIHWLLEKSDKDTKIAWAKLSSEKDFPTMEEFMKFLGKECDEIEMLAGPSTSNQISPTGQKYKNIMPNRLTQANATSFEAPPCICCNEPHHLATCLKFKSLDINLRREFAQNNRVCYNCLSKNHRVTACLSKFGCRHCKRRHHTLLHDNAMTQYYTSNSQVKSSCTVPSQTLKINNAQVEEEASEPEHGLDQQDVQINLATNLSCLSTILPTALAKVKNNCGKFMLCRILLDSGSQASFISESCVQKLGLPRSKTKLTVSGIATSNQFTRDVTSIVLKSRFDTERTLEMNVFILNKLTMIAPVATFNKFFEILENGRLKGDDGNPIAQNTAFGWVLSGETSSQNSSIHNLNITVDDDRIDNILRKFFECKELDNSLNTQSNEEEEAIEEHFKSNFTREPDGRYKVALPFKASVPVLGQSVSMAIQRLKSVERRMLKDHEYKMLYADFMKTYLQLGHMAKIDEDQMIPTDTHHCYLPHHAVLKTSSTSTKLRTVFDGSCKTSNGMSLNENLMVGPTIQPALWLILLRFRTYPIALSADIDKMYRQIKVRDEDTNFQRVVWRQSPDLPIGHFRLQTVTYGMSAAPFLAIRSLCHLAIDNESTSPRLANIIRKDFYVDDLLTGATYINEAVNLKQQLVLLLESGGFPLRKWVSNIPALCDAADPITIDDNQATIKVLGLAWDPKNDVFQFNVKLNNNIQYTKRTLLSESSKVFDPLGWLAPSIITIKILFQKLWLYKLGWDDELPSDITNQWCQLRDNFGQFQLIQIPRYIPWNTDCIQFHGFCDASEAAYAAVIYSRIKVTNGNIQVNLLTSKTKVAPLKQITLPRLELCAAVLLSRLFNKVKKEFKQFEVKEFGWTDSTIVLAWLSAEPRRWKTFVANRTSEILCSLPRSKWDHVKSTENPADCVSRGISPEALKSS